MITERITEMITEIGYELTKHANIGLAFRGFGTLAQNLGQQITMQGGLNAAGQGAGKVGAGKVGAGIGETAQNALKVPGLPKFPGVAPTTTPMNLEQAGNAIKKSLSAPGAGNVGGSL